MNGMFEVQTWRIPGSTSNLNLGKGEDVVFRWLTQPLTVKNASTSNNDWDPLLKDDQRRKAEPINPASTG